MWAKIKDLTARKQKGSGNQGVLHCISMSYMRLSTGPIGIVTESRNVEKQNCQKKQADNFGVDRNDWEKVQTNQFSTPINFLLLTS